MRRHYFEINYAWFFWTSFVVICVLAVLERFYLVYFEQGQLDPELLETALKTNDRDVLPFLIVVPATARLIVISMCLFFFTMTRVLHNYIIEWTTDIPWLDFSDASSVIYKGHKVYGLYFFTTILALHIVAAFSPALPWTSLELRITDEVFEPFYPTKERRIEFTHFPGFWSMRVDDIYDAALATIVAFVLQPATIVYQPFRVSYYDISFGLHIFGALVMLWLVYRIPEHLRIFLFTTPFVILWAIDRIMHDLWLCKEAKDVKVLDLDENYSIVICELPVTGCNRWKSNIGDVYMLKMSSSPTEFSHPFSSFRYRGSTKIILETAAAVSSSLKVKISGYQSPELEGKKRASTTSGDGSHAVPKFNTSAVRMSRGNNTLSVASLHRLHKHRSFLDVFINHDECRNPDTKELQREKQQQLRVNTATTTQTTTTTTEITSGTATEKNRKTMKDEQVDGRAIETAAPGAAKKVARGNSSEGAAQDPVIIGFVIRKFAPAESFTSRLYRAFSPSSSLPSFGSSAAARSHAYTSAVPGSPSPTPRLYAIGPYRRIYRRLMRQAQPCPYVLIGTGSGCSYLLDFVYWLRAEMPVLTYPVYIHASTHSFALLQFLSDSLFHTEIKNLHVFVHLTSHDLENPDAFIFPKKSLSGSHDDEYSVSSVGSRSILSGIASLSARLSAFGGLSTRQHPVRSKALYGADVSGRGSALVDGGEFSDGGSERTSVKFPWRASGAVPPAASGERGERGGGESIRRRSASGIRALDIPGSIDEEEAVGSAAIALGATSHQNVDPSEDGNLQQPHRQQQQYHRYHQTSAKLNPERRKGGGGGAVTSADKSSGATLAHSVTEGIRIALTGVWGALFGHTRSKIYCERQSLGVQNSLHQTVQDGAVDELAADHEMSNRSTHSHGSAHSVLFEGTTFGDYASVQSEIARRRLGHVKLQPLVSRHPPPHTNTLQTGGGLVLGLGSEAMHFSPRSVESSVSSRGSSSISMLSKRGENQKLTKPLPPIGKGFHSIAENDFGERKEREEVDDEDDEDDENEEEDEDDPEGYANDGFESIVSSSDADSRRERDNNNNNTFSVTSGSAWSDSDASQSYYQQNHDQDRYQFQNRRARNKHSRLSAVEELQDARSSATAAVTGAEDVATEEGKEGDRTLKFIHGIDEGDSGTEEGDRLLGDNKDNNNNSKNRKILIQKNRLASLGMMRALRSASAEHPDARLGAVSTLTVDDGIAAAAAGGAAMGGVGIGLGQFAGLSADGRSKPGTPLGRAAVGSRKHYTALEPSGVTLQQTLYTPTATPVSAPLPALAPAPEIAMKPPTEEASRRRVVRGGEGLFPTNTLSVGLKRLDFDNIFSSAPIDSEVYFTGAGSVLNIVKESCRRYQLRLFHEEPYV